MGYNLAKGLAAVVRAACSSNPQIATVELFAKRAQLSNGTAGRVRLGDHAVQVDKLPGIAHALGMSLGELMRRAEAAALGTDEASGVPTPYPPAGATSRNLGVAECDLAQWIGTLTEEQHQFLLFIRATLTGIPSAMLTPLRDLLSAAIGNPDNAHAARSATRPVRPGG